MADYAVGARPVWPRWLLLLAHSAALVLMASACDSRPSANAGGDQPSFGMIEAEPFVTLGSATAQADQPFFRITGVYRLPDENTVVADASQQLRWFDSTGRLVRTVGGEGHGANKYQALMWMRGYRGDSLIAYEAATGQLRVLDAEGFLTRSFHFVTDRLIGLALPHSPFPDGSLLVMAGPSHVQERGDGWWAVLRLVTFTPDGGPGEDLGPALRHPCGRPVEHCAAEFKPYQGTWTAGQRGVYIARPDRTEIRMVTGNTVEILKGPEGCRRTPEGGLPTYSRLLLDSEGYLWAQSGHHSGAAVFDQKGQLKGVIEVPPQLQIHQVGLDYVVGVIEGEAGIERVQLHKLHRVHGS